MNLNELTEKVSAIFTMAVDIGIENMNEFEILHSVTIMNDENLGELKIESISKIKTELSYLTEDIDNYLNNDYDFNTHKLNELNKLIQEILNERTDSCK